MELPPGVAVSGSGKMLVPPPAKAFGKPVGPPAAIPVWVWIAVGVAAVILVAVIALVAVNMGSGPAKSPKTKTKTSIHDTSMIEVPGGSPRCRARQPDARHT